jgi:hypothetical protein
MVASPPEALEEMARLPPIGTPERLVWDDTIRQVNELYPDWASIGVANARLSRTTYEKQHAEPDGGLRPVRCSGRRQVTPAGEQLKVEHAL